MRIAVFLPCPACPEPHRTIEDPTELAPALIHDTPKDLIRLLTGAWKFTELSCLIDVIMEDSGTSPGAKGREDNPETSRRRGKVGDAPFCDCMEAATRETVCVWSGNNPGLAIELRLKKKARELRH
jgi:hypothetical protein